ncbi:MAG: hypothetical protein IKH57_16665 [Clostridia bacterium]|nr:hypothetical protein [Clostridia bacterium]
MKYDGTLLKRIVAFLLTLSLVFTSGDFVPGIAAAIAEGEQAEAALEQRKEEESDALDAKAVSTAPVAEEATPVPAAEEALPVAAVETLVSAPAEENVHAAADGDDSPAKQEPAVEETKQEETPAEQEPMAEKEQEEENPVAQEPVTEAEQQEENPVAQEPVTEAEQQEENPVVQEPVTEAEQQEENPVAQEPVVEDEQQEEITVAQELVVEDEQQEEPSVAQEPVAEEEREEEAPVAQEPVAEEEEQEEETPVAQEPVAEDEQQEEITVAQEPVAEDEQQEDNPVEQEPVTEAEQQEENLVEQEPVAEGEQQEENLVAQEPIAEEEQQEENPVAQEPVAEEEQQEENPVAQEPVAEEEQQEENLVAQEPIAEEEQQEENPIAQEPIAEEEQQEENPVAQEPVLEEEQQEEKPAAQEPAAEEEQQEETSVTQEPAAEGEQDNETPAEPEPAVEKEQQEDVPVDLEAIVEKTQQQEPLTEQEPAAEKTPAAQEPDVEAIQQKKAPAAQEQPVADETQQEALPAADAIEEALPADDSGETPAVGLFVLPSETEETNPMSVSAAASEPRILTTQVGDYVITACGNIPEGAEIQAVEIPADQAEKMLGKKTLFAYDIRLIVDGQVWQPGENGTNVQISVQDTSGSLKEDHIDILHVKADLMDSDGSLSEEAVEKTVQELSEGSVETEKIASDTADGVVSFETTGFSGFLASAMAKLQAMFNDALKAETSLNRKVQIDLENDTTYEGDVTFSAGDRTVEDGFEVEFVTKDAGEDRLQSEGTTTVAGNITIQGIPVRLTGVRIAAGNKVAVQADAAGHSGKLEYYGTKQDDDIVVEVSGDNSEAKIYTGAGNDTVQVTAEAGSVTVDTGDGKDEVELVTSGKSATVNTGADNDTVQLTANAGTVAVDTGDGDDTVYATVENSSAVIQTGAGDDSVNASLEGSAAGSVTIETDGGKDAVQLTADAALGTAAVDTGDGSDSVEIDINTAGNGITVDTGAGNDTVSLAHTGTNQKPTNGPVNVKLGAGDDTATVGILIADGTKELDIDAGEGEDVLHLSGFLDPETDENERATGTETDMTFVGRHKNKLHITTTGFTFFSDDLENKRTVTLNPVNGVVYREEANGNFTNFLVSGSASALSKVTVIPAENASLVFSNLLIKEAEGENKVVINEGAEIDARGMKLTIEGKDVEINGTLKAATVSIQAKAGGKAADPGESLPLTILDKVESGDLFHVIDDARIVIGNTGAVFSSGDVILLSQVEQSGGIINVPIASLNAVNVKVGRASVDIAGKIYAGYDFDRQAVGVDSVASNATDSISERGVVRVNAQVKTTMGLDAKGKAENPGLALAVAVADADASVNIKEGAVVEAAKDVTINSKTELNVAARADSGTLGAPFAVAVAVLISDSHNTVDGKVTSQKGSVKISADGKTDASTTADKGKKDENISGVYAAVSVVLQDVQAALGSHAVVNAKNGSAQVASGATENVKNQAVSAAVPDGSEESKTKNSDGIISSLKGTLLPKVKEMLGNNSSQDRVASAVGKIPFANSAARNIQQDPETGKTETSDDLFAEKEKGDAPVDLKQVLSDVKSGTDESGQQPQQGETQITGTLAVTVATNDSQALIDTGAQVNAGANTDVAATLKTDVYTFADGRAAAPGKTEVDTSLGVGIAVSVVDGEGRADVKGSVATGGNVNVKSDSVGQAKAEAKAGYSKGDTGIGGAVAVQVASLDSKALAHKTADIKTNSGLNVNANSDITYSVNSDASGKTGKNTGVGAGVSVAVDGADTYAAIQDGVKLSAKTEGNSVKGVSVTATGKLHDVVKALSGAAGGTSVVPAAAVNVTGIGTEAYIGTGSADPLSINGNVTVSAKTNSTHEMKADAAAIGAGAAVGTGISVSVVTDAANARLNQSVDAKDVTVATETAATVTNSVTATAAGGNKEKNKSADGQADGLLGTAGKLAGKNHSNSVSTDQIEKAKSGNRQKAETSEGSVGVAGAVLVNVQDSVSNSEIMKGVSVNASGTAAVTALNVASSKVKADAGVTNSDVGVGVGVAVNIINLSNIAKIGDGEIKAAILNVTAKTKIKEPAEKQDEKETLRKLLSEKAAEFIAELLEETGLDQYLSAEKLDEIKADMASKLPELLEELSNIDTEEAKTRLAKILREAAKKAYVSVANEAISALSDQFDLALKAATPKATGHVIDTQAVSGAGTRDVGVSGSVAITVLNAENSASIADGAAITVTGDMTVEAKELRSVNNVASAVTDKKGKAVANKNAGSAETKDAGGGSEAESIDKNKNDTVKLTVGVGGTAQIVDKEQNRPRVYIDLKDGYKMPEGNKVDYSFDDGSGFEKTGTLTAQKDENGRWYVDTNSNELSKGILTSLVSLKVTPVAIDYKVPTPTVLSTEGEDSGKVKVKVGDGEAKGESQTAHVGDKVELKVEKKAGRAVSKLSCVYQDKDGNDKELQLARGTETDKEVTYVFNMPAGNIEKFVVAFDSTSEQNSESSAKDGNGKRVGVGAAFSMVYGESITAAEIGKRGAVDAGALSVTASSEHEEDIAGAAGTDPLLDEQDLEKTKKTAVDASVALNILDNDIKAAIAAGMTVSTRQGDLTVSAAEISVTATTASAFSVGDRTAVGATAAVNIANTAVKAEILADAEAAGNAAVSAYSHSEDTTKAIATAMGADIARDLKKLKGKVDDIQKEGNKLLDGSIIDELDDSKAEENKTADKINTRLNEKKKQQDNKEEDAKTNANKNNSLSSNVLRTQDVKAQGENAGGEGTQEVEKQIKDLTGQDVGANRKEDENDNKKWQVAAAVGVTVSDHEAVVTVSKITAQKKIQVSAVNNGNFNTLGTAAAMSMADHANSIAAGVAVSVNANKAKALVNQNLMSKGQDEITVTSRLTQNLDGDFAGKLAVQSLSGSVAGKDSDVSIAGAVSVLVSNGESTVNVASSEDARTELNGGDITVEATDQSKLAIRAGGVSLSKGSSLGMGLASATVVSHNNVAATVGDYITVNGKSFKLNAEKQAVTAENYQSLVDQKYFVSDSSNLTDAERKQAQAGLIDIHKGEDDKNYKMEIRLSSNKLLDALDGLNFLSSQNTYVEAISGSVMTGKGKASVAGSFAVAVTNNKVNAALGSYATVHLTGDMNVTAHNGSADKAATTRIIAGSLGAGTAKTSVGATIAVLVDNDQVKAETLNKADFFVDGNYTQEAVNSGEIQVFTAAMAVAVGDEAGTAAGGAVNVIVSNSAAKSAIGKEAVIQARKNINVLSDTQLDLIAVSGSANVSAGSDAKVAAGGVVNVIVDNAAAETELAESVILGQFSEAAIISSNVSDRMVTGTASLSAAPTGSGKAVAGVANVIVSNSKAHTTLNEDAWVSGSQNSGPVGSVKIAANNDAYLLNAGLSLAGASGVAVGAAFNVNVLNREAIVDMKDEAAVTCMGEAVIQATGSDIKILAALSAGGSMDSAAVSGNVAVLAESSKIKVLMGKDNNIYAEKSVNVESYLEDTLIDVAGNIAASNSSAAVGVASVTVIKNNEVTTDLGNSIVKASAIGNPVRNKSGEDVRGIYIGANAKETQFVGGAGMAASGGSAAVNGVVTVLVNNNKILSDASKAKMTGRELIQHREWTVDTVYTLFSGMITPVPFYIDLKDTVANELYLSYITNGEFYINSAGKYVQITSVDQVTRKVIDQELIGEISVKAKDDTKQLLLAGSVNASSGFGAGAAVVTLVSNKDVQAKAHEIYDAKNINVSADNKDDIKQLAVSVGVSGGTGVQIGAAVQVLKSKAVAEVDGNITNKEGDFNLTANNDATLCNIGAAVAGTSNVAVAPVGVVTYFQGETAATLDAGSTVEANNINIKSTANKDINLFAAGATAAGNTGISGTVSVLVSKDTNKAAAAENANVKAGDSLNVEAQSDYQLLGASGVIAGAGNVAVGVNAVVSILKSSSIAEVGSQVAARNVNVKAYGKRDVIDVGLSLGAAGTTGVGVTVMVLAAGAAMSQDAADMIMYANGDSKDEKAEKKGFDAAKFMGTAESSGVESKHYSDILTGKTLQEDMKGNGHHETAQQIGHQEKDKDGNTVNTFDASSRYRSSDLDNSEFNNDGDYGRGENLDLSAPDGTDNSDTLDVKKTKKANVYHYYDPTDAVIARITEHAVVDAQQVAIEAKQPVTVDLIGAALGGGTVGVGISTAVAILHSNVSASSMGEIRNANITVSASSVSGEIKTDDDAKARGETMADLMSNKPTGKDDALEAQNKDEVPEGQDKASLQKDLLEKVKNRSIRVLGVAVGGGAVSVAVSASVALTDNTTQAVLGGKVTNAGNINISSNHDYGAIMAGTGALGGGAVGVGASASVAQADGRVKARVDGSAVIESSKSVTISTNAKVDVDALAMTVGGGAVAVNAGVGLAFNRLQQETAIDMGANVTSSGDVNLTAITDSSAHSYLLGVSVGAVAGSLNAAVTDVATKVKTHIGQSVYDVEDGQDSLTDDEEFPIATVKAKNITLSNNVKQSLSEPVLLSVAAGAAALGGNVLLAFNDTHVEAMIDNGDISAETLDVVSNLNGAAKSSLTAAQVGAITVGVSVNYADMRAYNTAHIRNSAIKTTVSTNVETNRKAKPEDEDFATTAEASTVAASIGAITVGLNAAIARNNSGNYATVIGDGSRIMDFNALTMHARGTSNAEATLEGVSVSGINIAGSTVVALNDADTRTTVLATKLKEGEYTDDPPKPNTDPDGEGKKLDDSVKDRTNVIAKDGLTLDVTSYGDTKATVTTGGGSLISLAVTVAMAYGRTSSLVDAVIHGGGEYAFVSSTNTARSNTQSIIQNKEKFDAITMAAKYGAAYTQDIFRTSLQQTGGTITVTGDVNMLTDYETNTTASVTPSINGVVPEPKISLGSLEANVAIARNTAMASAEYEKSIDEGYSDSEIGGKLTIKTLGSAIVDAEVVPAQLRISGLSAAANIAIADLSVIQAAALTMGGRMNVGGDAVVTSDVKSGGQVKATASIGGISAGEGFDVNLVKIDVSKAVAQENMYNSAIVRGGAYGVKKVEALVDKGYYVTDHVDDYDYDLVESFTYTLKKYPQISVTSSEDEEIVKEEFKKILSKKIPEKMASIALQAGLIKYQVEECCEQVRYFTTTWIELLEKTVYHGGITEEGRIQAYNYCFNKIAENAQYQDSFAKIAEYEKTDDKATIIKKMLNYSEDDFSAIGSYYYDEFVTESFLDWEETPNYAKTTQYKSVWEPHMEKMEVEVPIYSIDKNHLYVHGSLNIYAHSATGSEARTDSSAFTLSLVSAGSSNADAFSTDNLSAIVEGMHVKTGGDLSITAKSDTQAESTGYQAGGFSIANATKHNSKARVGTNDRRQYVGVVVGDKANIEVGGKVSIQAVNEGAAKASMKSGTNGSLASGSSSSQPTESWYNTLISIGQNTNITSEWDISILSSDTPTAESIVKTSDVSLFMNFGSMKGQNLVRQENNIDFGEYARLLSNHGSVTVDAVQKTVANAETWNDSVSFGYSGANVQASNFIDRVVRVNLRQAQIVSEMKTITVTARSGEGDSINTTVYTGSKGLISASKATATAEVTSNAEIILGEGARMDSCQGLLLEALATSYKDHKDGNENNPGVNTTAQVDALSLVAVPNAVAKNTLTFNTYIQINDCKMDNPNLQPVVLWNAYDKDITVKATNSGLRVSTDASSKGKGGGGVSNATAWNIADMHNVIWVNKAEFHQNNQKTNADSNITLIATNGDSGRDRPYLTSKSYAELDAIAGKVAPTSRLSGQQVNQVRTDDTKSVSFSVREGKTVTHQASTPNDVIRWDLPANYKRWEIVIDLKFVKITITMTTSEVVQDRDCHEFFRDDFSGTGQGVDVRPTAQKTIEERYKSAYDNALLPLALIKTAALGLGLDLNATIGAHLARGLLPLTYLNTLVSRPTVQLVTTNGLNGMTYSEKMNLNSLARTDALRGMELVKPDNEDIIPDKDIIPDEDNDTDNNGFEIAYASNNLVNPVLTIRDEGELNFISGVFTIPRETEAELYLREISAKWLIDRLVRGFFRPFLADQDAMNAFALGNGKLPQGEAVDKISMEADEESGKTLYWIGYTPDTAPDNDTVLLYLAVNKETDRVEAFRTTPAMISRDEEPIPVSLFLFRASESGLLGQEKYNLMFFDTPAGEESVIRIVTGAADGQPLANPQPLRVILHGIPVAGTDFNGYAIHGRLFVMSGSGVAECEYDPDAAYRLVNGTLEKVDETPVKADSQENKDV